MENPTRTMEHLQQIAQRREALRAALAEMIPPQSEFIWEVGCGHGHFLAAYAQAHPQQLCIGIDVILERIERANRKRDRARLPRLHFLRAEAHLFLEALPPDAKFTAVYMLFPDPWPKRRHHKHRLMQFEFLNAIAKRAGEGARLYFRTDHPAYFCEVEALVRAHGAWRLVEEPWLFEVPTVFQERVASYRSLVAARTRAPAIY